MIESGSELATFGVTWKDREGLVLLELISPEGETIVVNAVPGNVRQIFGKRPYMAFQVERPAPGAWKAGLRPKRGGDLESQFFVFSQQPRIDGALWAPRRRYRPGDVVPCSFRSTSASPSPGCR